MRTQLLRHILALSLIPICATVCDQGDRVDRTALGSATGGATASRAAGGIAVSTVAIGGTKDSQQQPAGAMSGCGGQSGGTVGDGAAGTPLEPGGAAQAGGFSNAYGGSSTSLQGDVGGGLIATGGSRLNSAGSCAGFTSTSLQGDVGGGLIATGGSRLNSEGSGGDSLAALGTSGAFGAGGRVSAAGQVQVPSAAGAPPTFAGNDAAAAGRDGTGVQTSIAGWSAPDANLAPLFVANSPSTGSRGDDSIVCIDAGGALQTFLPPDSTLNGLGAIGFSPDGTRLYAVVMLRGLLVLDVSGTIVDEITSTELGIYAAEALTVAPNGAVYVAGYGPEPDFPMRLVVLDIWSHSATNLPIPGLENFTLTKIAGDEQGTVYVSVVDPVPGTHWIYKVSPQGNLTLFLGPSDGLEDPWGIAYVASTRQLWTTSSGGVMVFTSDGVGRRYAEYYAPEDLNRGIAIDATGRPWLPFERTDRLIALDETGEVTVTYSTGLHMPGAVAFAPPPFACGKSVAPIGNCNYDGPNGCSGHGQCAHGGCVCADYYTGTTCDQCIAGHKNYPTCECEDIRYAGINCDQCAAGRSGYPYCRTPVCVGEDVCCGHGTWDASAATCSCDPGYSGIQCDTCLYSSPSQNASGVWLCCPSLCPIYTICYGGMCVCLLPRGCL